METFIRQIQRWRCLGFDWGTFLEFRSELDTSNLKTLRVCLLIVIASNVLSAAAFIVFQRDLLRLAICLSLAAALLVVFFCSRTLLRNGIKQHLHARTTVLLVIASLIMYAGSIYLGTVASNGDLAVIIVWLFLFLQIAFDVPPLQNVLTVLPCYAAFLLCSRFYKSPTGYFFDCIHATFSVMVGLVFSYRKTRLTLTNIVTSSMLKRSNYVLYHTSTTDELTGLPNRRKVFEKLELLRNQCRETGCHMACAVLDLDDFKKYNDQFGHPAGDALLRKVGKAMLDYSEAHGVVAGRIGGEEFLAAWQTTDPDDSGRIAEELRDVVSALNTPGNLPEGAHITVSAGVCTLEPALADRAYAYADRALYRAKDGGKNRSCQYEPELDDFMPLALTPED